VNESWEVAEFLTAEPARALAGLLGVPSPVEKGGRLPLGWHWVYLLERLAQADLGRDGHPMRHVFPTPPQTGMRRMWAGGQMETLRGLEVGRTATRVSRIANSVEKHGRSGPLVFVTVEHVFVQDDEVRVRELQDIVYRTPAGPQKPDEASPGLRLPVNRPPTADEWQLPIDPTFLFRFSALTYNAHRIHYDRKFAWEVEGYPGLVTHGPLQALAMAEAARLRANGTLDGPATFRYRLDSPLFEHQGLIVAADGNDEDPPTWTTRARDVTGRQSASGSLRATTQ
jgi:3-methylfumaryl-CoA hydratase